MKRLVFRLSFAAALVCGANASASTFSVESSGNTFTVSRSGDGTNAAESVFCRTVSRSALAGVHFAGALDRLDFAAGDTSKTVSVAESTAAQVNDPRFTYYQSGGATGSSRAYRLEVVDAGGFVLAAADRSISYDASKSVSSSAFNANALTVSSGEITVTDRGFTQAYHAVPLGSYFSSSVPQDYLSASDARICMTLDFQAAEVSDGYQHVQILTNNTATCDNSADGGNPGTPSLSCYLAGFEHEHGSKNTNYRKYSFPVTSAGSNCGAVSTPWSDLGNDIGNLCQQNFRSGTRAADGRLAVLPSISTLGIRFTASGSDNDDWKAKSVVARLQAVPAGPSLLLNPVVSDSPVCKGTVATVSLSFNEIVTVTGTPTLSTTWGDLSYVAGSGANVLSFSGTVTAAPGTQLRLTGLSGGTVKGLTGTSFAWPGNLAVSGRTVGSLSAPPRDAAGFYLLSTPAHLSWFADRIVSFPNTSAALASDIDLSAAGSFPAMGGAAGFRGVFDGRGHALSGLTVDSPDSSGASPARVGLFGLVAAQGVVTNLVLSNATVTASAAPAFVGAVCGRNLGMIAFCSVSGTVATSPTGVNGSGTAMGGVCGENAGTVSACRAADSSHLLYNRWPDTTVGGIAGVNAAAGTLESCYFHARYFNSSSAQYNVTRGAVCGSNAGAIRDCVGLHDDSNWLDGCIGSNSGTTNNVPFLDVGTPFSGGAACYALNGGVTDGSQPWYQALGADDLPLFAGPTVYLHGSEGYVNAIVHDWHVTAAEHSPDYSNFVWTATCSFCAEAHDLATNGTAEVTTQPTCTEPGQTTWTYAIPANGYIAVAVTNTAVQPGVPPALGHDWGAPEYAWAEGGASATASASCIRNGCGATTNETVAPALVPGLSLAPACTEPGTNTFAAAFSSPLFAPQTNAFEVAALGHAWDAPTYVWAADDSTVAASNACTRCGETVQETVASALVPGLSPAPDCTTPGTNTFSAAFASPLFAPQTNAVEVAALGHDWAAPVWTWNVDYTAATAAFVCSRGDVEETVAAAVARVPEGGGATNSTATATHHGETFTDTVIIRPPVSYIDADGVERQCIRYTVLVPGQTIFGGSGAENWYVVTNDIAYTRSSLRFKDDLAHLILCDGATLTANANVSYAISASGSLTIYGQAGRTGTISASANINAICANVGITVNGGIVEATTPNPDTYYGISADRTATINGGVVRGSVRGGYGLAVNGGVVESSTLLAGNNFDIVLGWRNATDSIAAGRYSARSVSVKAGQSLTDGTAVYQGAVDPADIAGKTLRPCLPWRRLQAMLDAGGAVTLPADVIAADGDATLVVTNAVTLDLNGHTIDAAGRFGAITVLDGGDLTLTNGVPESGAITGGHASDGGGVYVAGGAFTMAGGAISGNTAVYGGGVYVDSGTFTMTGGAVSGNAADWYGGGVYVYGAFTLSGGTVSGNTAFFDGGGVYVGWDGAFTVSGGPAVSGNTNSVGAAGNVFLRDSTIAVDGLSSGASIGVTTATAPTATAPVAFATGASAGDAAHFTSDKPGFAIDAANGELRLWKPATPWDLLQMQLDAGGAVTLANDVTATDGDATLTVTNAVTLDLNGHTLDAAGRFGVIQVLEGGDLTLTNSVDGAGAITGGGVYVDWHGAFAMTGGAISGNTAVSGGGVFVYRDGTFTMSGGAISGNTASYAGGVEVYGTFTMTGGAISGNTAVSGGGVFVDGAFTMSGGEISGNAAADGGGVRVGYRGAFTMSGGEISGNTAEYNGGGVVCVESGGAFTMSGGAISGNTADYGGGVFVSGNCAFTMSGGTISGNAADYGGGVYVDGDYTFTVSGSPVVSGNTNSVGAANNVYLYQNSTITVDGLSEGASIGMTTGRTPTESSPVAFATGASEGDETHFKSDDPGCHVERDGGTLLLAYGMDPVPYIDADGVERRCYFYTVLTNAAGGVEYGASGAENWYVVAGDVLIGGTLRFHDNNAHLILCDGATLAVTNGNGNAIKVDYDLFIYGQTNGTGVLDANGSHSGIAGDCDITINGGTVVATGENSGGICAADSVTINGGTVNADGDSDGIWACNDITLGWSDFADSIFVSRYSSDDGTISVKNGQALTDGTAVYQGAVDPADIAGKTLWPCLSWRQLQAWFDAGGAVTLRNDVTAADGDATLVVTNAVTLDLNGHTIDAAGRFGVIEVSACGDLTLTNGVNGAGAITGGNAFFGGGVSVEGGTFTMDGGEISGNTATFIGGGVFVGYLGVFTMTGGAITGNAASYAGGGVFVNDLFAVSGSPAVSGNTNSVGVANSVYLSDGNTIAVDGLSADASIGVTTDIEPTVPSPVPFATGAAVGDDVHFTSDNPAFAIDAANGELRLVKPPTTPWGRLQVQLNAGGIVVLTNDVTAADGDETLRVTTAVTLDLNGHVLDADGRFRVIEIRAGGDLTLTNGVTESGAVTGGKAYSGGGVFVGNGGAFTMAGGTISGNAAADGGGVFVYNGGTFTMTGGAITGNATARDCGGVFVDGSFAVSGGPAVSGNTNSVGAANNVYLPDGNTIAVNGLSAGASIGVTTEVTPILLSPVSFATGAAAGDAAHFTSDNPAFAIDAANGELRLVKPPATPWERLQVQLNAGGTVTLTNDVTATAGDATLRVTNAVTLDLNGHVLDAAGRFGVIIILANGDLTLTNGVPGSGAVTGGSAVEGGGVCVYHGTFTMSGGTISGNTASYAGGGVYVDYGCAFTMTGGAISGNAAADKGGGVYVGGGTFKVSGVSVVSDNTNSVGTANNVHLASSRKIAVDGLSAGARLGVTTATAPTESSPVAFATGASAGDETHFKSDDSGCHVERDGGTLLLVVTVFRDPEGRKIEDPAVINWLSENGFTQDDIDALGNAADATDRLYECWLLNLNFKVQDAGATLRLTGIAVSNGVVSITVQFARKAPLGRINGMLYFYGATDLAAGFGRSPIDDVSVSFGPDDDPSFSIAPTTALVTQSVTATFSTAVVTETFFKAAIEVVRPNEPEDP